jgi:DNA polymerase-1
VLDFDRRALMKVLNIDVLKHCEMLDTFVLSQMLHPDRPSHSLESYAPDRKVQHEDWSVFSEDMLTRCIVDVDINLDLLEQFLVELQPTTKPSINWDLAVEVEHFVATEVADQSTRGCPIRTDKLDMYLNLLQNEVDVMYQGVEELLGWYIEAATPTTKVFKLNGEHMPHVANYWGDDVVNVVGVHTKVEFKKVRLTQHDRVKDILLSLGWQPSTFTDKGSPKLPKGDEWDEIALSSGNEGLSKLATYGSLNNRLDILKGWKSALRPDGHISHSAFTCGTPTARFRHSVIVNVPKATVDKKTHELVYYPDKQKVLFGTEMRHMIYCDEDDYVQVGIDLAGIELRLLAHVINDPVFSEVILNGDVHSFFHDKAKHLVLNRDHWKTSWYAWQFGAMDAKLGSTCTALPVNKRTRAAGKQVRSIIENSVPSLGKAIENLQKAATRGWIRGLDGRRIYVKTIKDTLNRYIQSAAAIIFKNWIVQAFKKLREEDIRFKSLIFYHDEIQSFVHKDDVEVYTRICLDTINEVGKMFKIGRAHV